MRLDPPETIRPTALQVDLARRIADDILADTYQTGAHLSEEQLAKQYQVSRTPVRGALKLLASKSLINYRPNSGYFVAPMVDGAAPMLEVRGMTADSLYRQLIEDRANRLLSESFTDRDLLQRYSVPRSVLAKTLVRLSAEALIEKRKGHGWHFPNSLENADTRSESHRFRAIVECAALMEPDYRVDPEALKRMRDAHEQLLAKHGEQIPVDTFMTLNTAFHEMLARFSHNRFIVQTVQQQLRLRRLEQNPVPGRAPQLGLPAREHLDIIKALEDDDRAWAAAIMRRHLVRD
jgi:DNA-binding GntR family transcriptional regulator